MLINANRQLAEEELQSHEVIREQLTLAHDLWNDSLLVLVNRSSDSAASAIADVSTATHRKVCA